MPLLDVLQFQQAAKDIVQLAHQQERSLTPRMIRKEVELRFSLEPGTLDSDEYKRPLKRAIESAIVSVIEVHDRAEMATENLPKKKSEPLRKSTTLAANPTHRPTAKRRRDDRVKEYKSASVIASSDGEDESERASHREPIRDNSREELAGDCDYSPDKRRKVAQADDMHIQETAFKNSTKSATKIPTSVDGAPHRRMKPKTPTETALRRKSRQTTTPKESRSSTSKDDATIKRLKSFVTACGVRKIWSRVFENIDVPAQQIKKLREILAELGMTGRLSLEQAKRIRQQRELAQELEDVQSFQQSIVERASRRHKASSGDEAELQSDADTGEVEDVTMVCKRRKRTAFQSITAFLEDQSDNE